MGNDNLGIHGIRMSPGVIMAIAVHQAPSGSVRRSLSSRLGRGAHILITLVAFALLCSSCGSAGSSGKSPGGNATRPQSAANPPPARNNPAVPVPSASPPPSPTGTIRVPQGEMAKVFTGPSVGSAVVTTLSSGTVVQILCTAQGDIVTNNAGQSSSLWDDTQYGYIPDVNVDTGTTRPVAPACT